MRKKLKSSSDKVIQEKNISDYAQLPTWIKMASMNIENLENYLETTEIIIQQQQRELDEEYRRGIERGKEIAERGQTEREARWRNPEGFRKIYNRYKDELNDIR